MSRRDLIYTSLPLADLPMSLPRQLWPENPPSKRQVDIVVHKRQVDLNDGFNITIVRDMYNLENVEPSLSPAQTLSQSIRMSFQESTAMSVTSTVSNTAALSQQATDMMTQDAASMSTYPVATDTESLPQPTTDNIFTAFPASSDASMSMASGVTATALPDVEAPMAPGPSTSSVPDGSMVISSDSSSISDSTMASMPSMEATDLPIHAVQLSPPQPTRYYAAPWYQLTGAFGAVPTNVKGITCYGGVEPPESCVDPDADTEPCGCDIDDEVWRVISLTRTTIGTSVVSYDGPVVVTASGQTSTTSVSFTSVVTTTREIVAGGIVKSTILTSSNGDDATVYATETSFPSVTMTMLPGDSIVGNSTVSITASVQDSSSIVDAAAPQNSPASISYPTDVSTPGLLDNSRSAMNTEIDGTTFNTSIVATETVTMTPLGAVAPPAKPTIEAMPGVTNTSALSMETSAVDVSSLGAR